MVLFQHVQCKETLPSKSSTSAYIYLYALSHSLPMQILIAVIIAYTVPLLHRNDGQMLQQLNLTA